MRMHQVALFQHGQEVAELGQTSCGVCAYHSGSEMGREFRGNMASGVANMEIVSDSLGKPQLLIDGSEGPAVSFAYEGDMMWVAVGGRIQYWH